MPINRRDLLEMLDMQDTIADVTQDIVNLLNLRRMCLPNELRQELIQFIEKSHKSVTWHRVFLKNLEMCLNQDLGDMRSTNYKND